MKTPAAILIMATSCILPAQTPGSASGSALPDDIIYLHFFLHVAKYQEIAAAAAASGSTSSPFLHSFRTKLGINPNEEEDLNGVAADFTSHLLVLQQQISIVVQAFRAKYPVGRLLPGVSLPPPPAALAALVVQKKALILAERDQLHFVLGDEEFARVDSLIRTQMAPTMVSTGASQ